MALSITSTDPSHPDTKPPTTTNITTTELTTISPPTSPTPSTSSATLLSLLANRRSYYNLTPTLPITHTHLENILSSTLLTVPSAFNTQSTRLILLLGASHQKFWEVTTRLLRAHLGADRWSSSATASKLASLAHAHGTILFYEDRGDVEARKSANPSYAGQFDAWTEQTSGMHQLAVWVALEAEGVGANVQHYNPVVDAEVAREFEVPESWRLRAQMVFGGIQGGRPAEKEKKPVEGRLRVLGAEEKE